MSKLALSLHPCRRIPLQGSGNANPSTMKRRTALPAFVAFLSAFLAGTPAGQSQPSAQGRMQDSAIRNVILMIPDGCSTELLSIGRWMNHGVPLNLDSRIRGLVKTYCSDSPIGDSAPTGSAYASGHRSQDGFISTYPARSMHPDGTRFQTDSQLAFTPMATLMEAAMRKGMATGLVFTCYFPHATPASFLAHTPDRDQYFRIAKQMTAQPCDLLFGGGAFFADSSSARYGFDAKERLEKNGIAFVRDFSRARQEISNGQERIWGLFAPMAMEFEIDRPQSGQPSLEEMTRLAISALSRNPEGFFLMVEGSRIDWGAHNNDVPGALHDFIAFDKAVGAAMDFARKDGNTLVVVVPDHQCGGPTLGNYAHNNDYATLSVQDIFQDLRNYRKSAEKAVSDILAPFRAADSLPVSRIEERLRQSLRADFGIDRPDSADTARCAAALAKKKESNQSVRALCRIINQHNAIGWTSHGHHGGDVFYASYHPQGRELSGVIDNQALAPYIAREAGLGNLDSLSRQLYAPASEVFAGKKMKVFWNDAAESGPGSGKDPLYLEVYGMEGKTWRIYPNSKEARIGRKTIHLPGVCIYNGMGFYLPLSCRDLQGKDSR